MKKNKAIFIICGLGILVCSKLLWPAAKAALPLSAKPEALNVLLITVDTLRYDHLSIYNSASKPTPNIDKLARQSWLFTHAFSHNPVTLPAHTNIMTGTTSLNHGVIDNTFFCLDKDHITLAKIFKQNGYHTAAFVGAFPVSRDFGLAGGFDLFDDYFSKRPKVQSFFAERPAEKVIAPAIQWLKGEKQKWFAWIHLYDPHQPFKPPMPYLETYADDLYSGEIAYTDAQLGLLFAYLDKNHLSGRTIIIFTADHGEALGEKGEKTHAYFAYNNTVHVPLFIHHPLTQAKTFDDNICHIDILPTICDMLGFAIPPKTQGLSALPLIKNGTRPKANREIYIESMTPNVMMGWAPLRGFISGNMKFIDLPICEYYDFGKDPNEDKNILTPQKTGEYKKTLQQLMQRLGIGKQQVGRTNVTSETQKKMRSLGYISGSAPAQSQAVYTANDDLKALLPIRNLIFSAEQCYKENKYDEGERQLREVIAKAPHFIHAIGLLTTHLLEKDRIADTFALLTEGLKNNPGDSQMQVKMGNLLAENGDPHKAIELLEKNTERQYFNSELFNALGIAYTKLAKYDEAFKSFQKAIKLDSFYDVAYSNLGNAYMMLAFRDKNPEYLSEAENQFKQALQYDPTLASAYNGLGSLYYGTNRKQEGIENWKKALELKPEYNLPLYNISIAYLENGAPEKALENFKKYERLMAKKLNAEQKRKLQDLIKEAESAIAAKK